MSQSSSGESNLVLTDLRIAFGSSQRRAHESAAELQRLPVALDGVSLTLTPGRCLALLGESGSGKSLTALALMRLLPDNARVLSGSALLDGVNLLALPESEMQQVRGQKLGMIFQEPMTSLNPIMSVGEQIAEALRAAHLPAAPDKIRSLLAEVGLPPERADAYPFQMSGGQRQRALIAMMLAGNPRFLIADEPTTALDVVVQAQILKLISRIQRERGMGLLLITHDIAVAAEMADDLAVAYAGQMVESGPAAQVLRHPRHPYTQALLGVQEGLEQRGQRLVAIAGSVPMAAPARPGPGQCRFAPRCEFAQGACLEAAPALLPASDGPAPPVGSPSQALLVRCFFPLSNNLSAAAAPAPVPVSASASASAPSNAPQPVLEAKDLLIAYPIRAGWLRRTVGQTVTVQQVSLQVAAGETLALVGESGCGKTTVARTLLQLQRQTSGQVVLDGQVVQGDRAADLQRLRQSVQIVFQDPYASLNPRRSVGEILEEGLISLCPEVGATERQERVAQLIQQVGLDPKALQRYPHAFSGGQRQRIAIARALAVRPRVLICDEPTSALDLSVQAQILNLLKDLQQQYGLSYLLISHNLPVVGYLADRVAVMQKGVIVETGSVQEVLQSPQHPYTQALLAAVPRMSA